jgi:uncharacterized membrane protein YccC
MLIAVFSAYMACLVAIATLLRDFRAYGCILAGYTVALISIADVDAPRRRLPVCLIGSQSSCLPCSSWHL